MAAAWAPPHAWASGEGELGLPCISAGQGHSPALPVGEALKLFAAALPASGRFPARAVQLFGGVRKETFGCGPRLYSENKQSEKPLV